MRAAWWQYSSGVAQHVLGGLDPRCLLLSRLLLHGFRTKPGPSKGAPWGQHGVQCTWYCSYICSAASRLWPYFTN